MCAGEKTPTPPYPDEAYRATQPQEERRRLLVGKAERKNG